jgi:general secretion pathway protein A
MSVYPKYFGLSEPSFSITPDPQYLFLSDQHREALAHLLYGASETGGFVLLTGEVGTGKTTVCRAFLEQLPDGVEVGLVLNPALTSQDLMAAVCQEFGVKPTPGGEASTKDMLDRLNSFLLDCHARARRPVLIIDEAQNLRPEVLEQVRLLTNLETTKHKLLQIFLVGQPELRTLLATDELRQLNQRITARFHLMPLSLAETAAYIRHRLSVAGVERPLFSRAAVRRVHHHSGGVPRLINLICDRALLGAAVSYRLQANAAIVDQAAREVRGSEQQQPWPRRQWLGMALAALLAGVLGVWVGATDILPFSAVLTNAGENPKMALDQDNKAEDSLTKPEDSDIPPAETSALVPARELPAADTSAASHSIGNGSNGAVDSIPLGDDRPSRARDAEPPAASPYEPAAVAEKEATELAPDARIASMTVVSPDVALGARPPRLLAVTDTEVAAHQPAPLSDLLQGPSAALNALLDSWFDSTLDSRIDSSGPRPPAVTPTTCDSLANLGLACEQGQGRWSDLRRFDRPAALQLRLADGREGQVTLLGLNDEYARIHAGEGRAPVLVPIVELDKGWSGDYLLLWRLPPSGERVIGRSAAAASIRWLRGQLRLWPAGDPLLPDNADYDQSLMAQVRAFQSAQGLEVDGIAGPHTLIMLANALDGAPGANSQGTAP